MIDVIGIVGTIVLLPLAIGALVIGFVRFAATVLVALAAASVSRLTAR